MVPSSSGVHRGGERGVAPLGISGGAPAPPGVSPPPGHPRGGVTHRWTCSGEGGEVLAKQYSSKICLRIFLPPYRRRFCNFLQNLALPPEGGRTFLREGGQKKSRAKTFNLECSPPLGKFLCTRLLSSLPPLCVPMLSLYYLSPNLPPHTPAYEWEGRVEWKYEGTTYMHAGGVVWIRIYI